MPEEVVFKKILLVIDAAAAQVRACNLAVVLAKLHGAQIIGLNIVDRTIVDRLARAQGKKPAEIEVELEEDGWRYLYHAEELAKDQGAHIVVLQEAGFPEETIVRKARELAVELIILGYRGGDSQARRAADRLIERVIASAECSVLVVKA